MTPRQKKRVRESFEKLRPISDCVSALFYIRLFELDPKLRRLFVGNMEKQGGELMQFITEVINALDDFDSMLPELERLGRLHVKFCAKDYDYGTVYIALLWSLEQGLDLAFTDEVKMAWTDLYELISGAMKAAAAEIAA